MTLCVHGFSTNLLLYNQTYICIDSLIQEVTESHHQSNKIQFLQPSTLCYMFSTNVSFYLLLLSKTIKSLKSQSPFRQGTSVHIGPYWIMKRREKLYGIM